MTYKIDADIKTLKALDKACREANPKMLRANLDFIWDKYIDQPVRDYFKPKPTQAREEKKR